MKKIKQIGIAVSIATLITLAACHTNPFVGDALYKTVEKYVSLGEHRTGTPTDTATSYWLAQELKASGYDVHFLKFPVKQFFLDSASVSSSTFKIKAFPLWWVNDSIQLNVSAQLRDARTSTADSLKGNIALLRVPPSGQTSAEFAQVIDSLTTIGVTGIVAITESSVGEIVAFNTKKDQKPWKIPVVLVAPRDSTDLKDAILEHQTLQISIQGKFKTVEARNVYGTIGTGSKYIVVSTPISGWFTCGGERGTGIAVWLALAKWAASLHTSYRFVFTGNSGHELNSEGAQQFLDRAAPPIDSTQLWIHLGAGVATFEYTDSANTVLKKQGVAPTRRFFYNQAASETFNQAFVNVVGQKVLTTKPGGELIHVAQKGYKRYVGISHGHPYFHVPTDDASTTSPQILEETAEPFRWLIELEINQ